MKKKTNGYPLFLRNTPKIEAGRTIFWERAPRGKPSSERSSGTASTSAEVASRQTSGGGQGQPWNSKRRTSAGRREGSESMHAHSVAATQTNPSIPAGASPPRTDGLGRHDQ